jgi:hypothetical protein
MVIASFADCEAENTPGTVSRLFGGRRGRLALLRERGRVRDNFKALTVGKTLTSVLSPSIRGEAADAGYTPLIINENTV